jgi:hypothetical protein
MLNTKKTQADLDADWLAGLTDDTAKVDFMKAKVAADAATEQCRIKETETTRRQVETDDDAVGARAIIRGIALAAVIIACLCATCVGYNKIDAQKAVDIERVHAEHGIVTPPPPPASASAAPAASK